MGESFDAIKNYTLDDFRIYQDDPVTFWYENETGEWISTTDKIIPKKAKYLFRLRTLTLDEYFSFSADFVALLWKFYHNFAKVKFLDWDELKTNPKNMQGKMTKEIRKALGAKRSEMSQAFLNSIVGNRRTRNQIFEMLSKYFLKKKVYRPKFGILKSSYKLRKIIAWFVNKRYLYAQMEAVRPILTLDALIQMFFFSYKFNIEGVKKNISLLLESVEKGVSPLFSIIFSESMDGLRFISENKKSSN